MSCIVGLALTATAFVAVPANAATYIGTLNGTITTGSISAFVPSIPKWFSLDLSDQAITIDFTADVRSNYYDPVSNFIYPKYVVNTFNVTFPDVGAGLSFGGTASNNLLMYPPGSADFSGGAVNGSFSALAYAFSDPNSPVQISFAFANAGPPGPLSGSGSAYSDYSNTTITVAYLLTSGSVTAAAVPEPAAWSLMIVGIGAIGGALRRRRRQARHSAA